MVNSSREKSEIFTELCRGCFYSYDNEVKLSAEYYSHPENNSPKKTLQHNLTLKQYSIDNIIIPYS